MPDLCVHVAGHRKASVGAVCILEERIADRHTDRWTESRRLVCVANGDRIDSIATHWLDLLFQRSPVV